MGDASGPTTIGWWTEDDLSTIMAFSHPSRPRGHPGPVIARCGRVIASATVWAAIAFNAAPVAATTWGAIDALRARLGNAGVKVVQRRCAHAGLKGLYHPGREAIVICRNHPNPKAVWNTLAHEATHHMQACVGGAITKRHHHRSMLRLLASESPLDVRSLEAYPRSQQLAELEARYTAQLPPEQVLRLFDRYCPSPATSAP